VSRPEGRRCAAGRLCSRTGSGTWNRGCVAPKSSTCGRAPHHLPVPVGVLNTRRARLMARSQRSRDLREADSRVGLHLVRQCLGAPSCGRGRREHHGASGGDAGGAAEAAAGAIAAMPTHTASCKRFMTSPITQRCSGRYPLADGAWALCAWSTPGAARATKQQLASRGFARAEPGHRRRPPAAWRRREWARGVLHIAREGAVTNRRGCAAQ
jgi:hypothetical protein